MSMQKACCATARDRIGGLSWSCIVLCHANMERGQYVDKQPSIICVHWFWMVSVTSHIKQGPTLDFARKMLSLNVMDLERLSRNFRNTVCILQQ